MRMTGACAPVPSSRSSVGGSSCISRARSASLAASGANAAPARRARIERARELDREALGVDRARLERALEHAAHLGQAFRGRVRPRQHDASRRRRSPDGSTPCARANA